MQDLIDRKNRKICKIKDIEYKKDAEYRNNAEQETAKRIINFFREDDETFFKRIIQELSPQEIEEFLVECPEYTVIWRNIQSIKNI